MNLVVTSANVLPRQTRLPPINGVNASGLRGLPSDVRVQIPPAGSNLSGTNL